MNTRTTTAPTVEPLTLAETKVHLREDLTDAGNDALITSLITVARQACEHRVQRALMLQTLEATLDAFPCASARNPDAAIELIMPPVIDVTSVTYTAANGSSTVLASTDYTLDARSEPARLVPAYGLSWPTTQAGIAAVRVVYRAGYTRVNLLDYSEGPVANWLTDGSETDATPIAGYSGSIQIGDNSATRFVYQTNFTPSVGVVYTVSAVVQMDDDSTPVVGAYNTAGVDFALVIAGSASLADPVVTPLGGNAYRVSMTAAAVAATPYFGVLKGLGNSAKGFRVTAVQANFSSLAHYQRVNTASDYTATGFPIAQLYDGVDDGMATAAFSAGTLTSGMDCMIAVRRDSAASTILGLASQAVDASSYFGACIPDSDPSAKECGTPTVWVDNVQLAGGTAVTRGTLNTALTAGDWHILEYRNLDLSAWTALYFARAYTGFYFNGARGDILLYPSTASTEDKDAARQWLADYYGVTLP